MVRDMGEKHIDAELRDELEHLITAGVEAALKDIGLNKQAADEVFSLRKDMMFLREMRTSCEEIRHRGMWYSTSLLILGLVALIGLGFKQWLIN